MQTQGQEQTNLNLINIKNAKRNENENDHEFVWPPPDHGRRTNSALNKMFIWDE